MLLTAWRSAEDMTDNSESKMAVKTKARLSPTFVVVMTLFIDAIGFGIIIPLLPFYTETLQAGSAALGVLVASFAVMQFFFSPVLGRISDNAGRKPVLVISILVSTISYVIFGFADSFLLLLLSRVIAGIATETAVAQAYIADITTEKNRAAGIGKVTAAHGAGFIIGPAIGGILSVYGFWAPGFAAAVLTLINLLFVLFFLPETNRKNQVSRTITPNSKNGSKNKILDALKKPVIGSVLVIHFVVFLAFSAVPVIVPLLVIAYFAFGSTELAYVFIYIGIVQILLQSFVIGRLTSKFGEENLIVIGPVLMIAGLFAMPLIPNIIAFFASMTMIASGSGIMRTVVPSFLSRLTPADEQGGILGIASSVLSIATVPGPLIGGFLFEVAGATAAFFGSSAILAVGLVFSFIVIRKYRRENGTTLRTT
ncbi:MFS transporter [Candidatus Bathyarchaeota archaeon]|nr:MFS transporter [Candidatus Bathyarchaeota archaeon]